MLRINIFDMPGGRGAKRKRSDSSAASTANNEPLERLSLAGGPHPGEPRTGHPTGNVPNAAEPSLLQYVDFEKILNESSVSAELQQIATNDPISESSHDNMPSLSMQTISFSENRVRLGAEDISSHVPTQLCKKIWAHEYINISLLLKGSVELQDLFSSGVVHLTGKGHLEARPVVNTKDKVTSIEKWTDAFLIFASIYLKRFPSKTQEILQYMNIIREAASRSATFTWRSYDEQFRLRQESEVESWGKINSDLWLRLMTSSTVTAPQASTTSNTSSTSKLDPTRVIGTCFDFNDGFCPRFYCKFKHVCSNCNNPNHGRVTCFRQASSASDRGSTNFRGPRGNNYNRGGLGRSQSRRGNRR